MSEHASFELGDISNFREVSDLAYIFFGILTVDVIVLFLTRYYKVGGKYLNEWYDKFDLLAVIAEIYYKDFGFLIYHLFMLSGFSYILYCAYNERAVR